MTHSDPVYINGQRAMEENCQFIKAKLLQKFTDVHVESIIKDLNYELSIAVNGDCKTHYIKQLEVINKYCNKYHIFI